MLDKKLLEVLTSPPDAAVAIVTQGKDGPHVVNSWNSYAQITEDDKILFPAGRMNETEQNIRANNRVKMTICNREVQGKSIKGTGFLVIGTAEFAAEGADYDTIKAKFPWARAALAIKVESAEQTL